MAASVGTVGDSYDNALAETVNGLYKTECTIPKGPWRNAGDLEIATATWVEFYNKLRLHGSLDRMTPTEFEAAYWHARRKRSVNPYAQVTGGTGHNLHDRVCWWSWGPSPSTIVSTAGS